MNESVIRSGPIVSKNIGKIIKLLCTECRDQRGKLRETDHKIVFSHEKRWDLYFEKMDSVDFDGRDAFQIVECMGCGASSFRHESYFSEDRYLDENTGESDNGIKSKLYPSRSSEFIAHKNFQHLSPMLRDIYREVIDSYNGRSYMLCAVGLRALVEGICSWGEGRWKSRRPEGGEEECRQMTTF